MIINYVRTNASQNQKRKGLVLFVFIPNLRFLFLKEKKQNWHWSSVLCIIVQVPSEVTLQSPTIDFLLAFYLVMLVNHLYDLAISNTFINFESLYQIRNYLF